MTYPHRGADFRVQACPGDVFSWWRGAPIGKRKYHLCLSYDFDFVFLNTPKDRRYEGDYRIEAHHVRFLKPTRVGFSSVSCANIQPLNDLDRFLSFTPTYVGNLTHDVLADVVRHILRMGFADHDEEVRLSEGIASVSEGLRPRGLTDERRAGRGRPRELPPPSRRREDGRPFPGVPVE